jgi:hypothetical protein
MDLTAQQWSAINSQLYAMQSKLLNRLQENEHFYIQRLHLLEVARQVNTRIAEVEFELSRAFTYWDTIFDITTQRYVLGKLLAGCEVIAQDALRIDHPAVKLLVPCVVFGDRGAGASFLREGIRTPYNAKIPMALIQIPYGRLVAKYDLFSLCHEVGHDLTYRLSLDKQMIPILKMALKNAGAETIISDLFCTGITEILPDLCGLLKCGLAQASSLRDILSVPKDLAFIISTRDPHPSPYIRVLLGFENCRQMWGKGVCDEMEKDWIEMYPLDNVPSNTLKILKSMRKYLPVVSKTLLGSRLSVLKGKKIPDLFDVSVISPAVIERAVRSIRSGTLNLKGLPPCAQLAVFRTIRDQAKLSEDMLDKIMRKWLIKLGQTRTTRNI